MPKLIERIRAGLKGFTQPDWVSSDLPGNRYSSGTGRIANIGGTRIHWNSVVGNIWECPAAQACLNWLWRNFPQAPPMVYRKGAGKWEAQPDHPLLYILNRPYGMDGSTLFQAFILDCEQWGNFYAEITRTRGGQFAELQFLRNSSVTPITEPMGDPYKIPYYEVWENNSPVRLQPENMFHGKYGVDPHDQRFGLSPIGSATRGIYTLQQAVNYGATMMTNFGTIGKILSAKDSTVSFDPQELKDKVDSQSQGDRAASTIALDFPIDVNYPGVTPQDMALDTVQDRPEADICALFGLPPQVVGLHVGRLSKTYANVREAREAAWEEKMMPMGAMFGCQLGYKLLPEFVDESVRQDPKKLQAYMSEWRLGFDYSEVRPLQPDLDALHKRLRDDWLAGLVSLADWKTETNGKPEKGDELIFYRDRAVKVAAPGQTDPNKPDKPEDEETPAPTPKKGLGWAENWAARIVEEEEARLNSRAVTNGNGRY